MADEAPTPVSFHQKFEWKRTPVEVTREVSLERSGSSEIAQGARLEWVVEPINALKLASVFLVNCREAKSSERPGDEAWIYQPRIVFPAKVQSFEPRRLQRDTPDPDPDGASADLIYRNRLEFAVGHGVAADWQIDHPGSDRAFEVFTEVIPVQEISKSTGPAFIPPLSMVDLACAQTPEEVAAITNPMLEAYDSWIKARTDDAASIPAPDSTVAHEHIQGQRRSLARMRAGLQTLIDSEDAFQSFKFANQAMAMQRDASDRVLRKIRAESPQTEATGRAEWRPFQLGFILQAISGLVDPRHEDREIAELPLVSDWRWQDGSIPRVDSVHICPPPAMGSTGRVRLWAWNRGADAVHAPTSDYSAIPTGGSVDMRV